MDTMTKTRALRRLLSEEAFIYMPVAYDALGSRLVQDTGFKAVYNNGGYVTGGTRCASEPLLTMDEQVRVAGNVAHAVAIPAVADGGAGFGEPLHTMRTVREFIRAGVAGIHIEDQLYPKRAHYHKYVAHAVPREEFVDKIKFACRARDERDKGLRHHRPDGHVPVRGSRRSDRAHQHGGRRGCRHGPVFPARP
jgi:2-methylisocitrate lyase-like PEP mutase family enzyme